MNAWLAPARGWVAFAAASALLVLNACSIDAVCDDAFISLRYARNVVEHGAPVYNLGERVEGYSSPLWMFLSALPLAAGIEGRRALSMLGAGAAIALIAAVWRLWNVIAPGKVTWSFLPLALIATSTPIAAWSSSGLETPLFSAAVALSVAEIASCLDEPTPRRACIAGALSAFAVLVRPEGALIAIVGLVALASRRTTKDAAIGFAAAAGLPVTAFVLWRYSYYGSLVPNTFFQKLSAAPWDRLHTGLRYALFEADPIRRTGC